MRSLPTIFDGLIAEKETLATLNGLVENSNSALVSPYQRLLANINSQSKVAQWRLLFFVVAVAIWLHEFYWDQFKTEVETRIKFATAGNIPWYSNMVFNYQHDHELVYKDKAFQYLVIDDSAKIIKRCSVNETGEQLTIKVATEVDGLPVKLSPAQFNGLSVYVKKQKFAGTRIQLVNENSDELRWMADVYYNPMVSGVKENTIAATINYLKNLDFNGAIYTNRFIDSVQAVKGVEDIVLHSFEVRSGTSEFAAIDRIYIPYAGHIKIYGSNDFTDESTDSEGNILLANSQGVTFKFIPYV